MFNAFGLDAETLETKFRALKNDVKLIFFYDPEIHKAGLAGTAVGRCKAMEEVAHIVTELTSLLIYTRINN